MRTRESGVAVVVLVLLVACGGNGNSSQGGVGDQCYPNGTCNVGLSCVGGICVAGPDAGDPDAGADAPTSSCGNGVVDTEVGETCDTAIASGTGACPASCTDNQACTTDSLANPGTCTAACTNTAIIAPTNGDGCCPTGANANTDNDCAPVCGNAVNETGETCDTGISTGTGSCPTACVDTDVCTTDTLMNGGTCTAACMFTAITSPANGDGCCPAGANANTDNDCTPMCGNSVMEPGEQCDDGDTDNFDGCDVACFSVDTSCIGQPLPTTAAATITLSGTASEVTISGLMPAIQPVVGASVTTCTGNCQGPNALDVQTTGMSGAFASAPLATGSVPLDAYVKLEKPGNRTTYLAPPSPFTASATGLAPISFTSSAFALLVGTLGVTQSAGNGTIGLTVVDCMNRPVQNLANVTLSIKQGGVDVGSAPVDLGTLSPSSAGTFLIFDVPPGATVVGASYYGVPLAAHTVAVVASSTTQTSVRPGGATGGLSLALSANKPGGNCGALGANGAGITSTTITLVHNSDSSCAPITLAISAGATQPAGSYTINCASPVVAPCIESDQTLTAAGLPSVGYTIHVRGRVGAATCWSNDDSLQVPVGAVLSRTLNLAFASGTPGC